MSNVRYIAPALAELPAIELFRMHYDTLDIAVAQRRSESFVYREINDQLSLEYKEKQNG